MCENKCVKTSSQKSRNKTKTLHASRRDWQICGNLLSSDQPPNKGSLCNSHDLLQLNFMSLSFEARLRPTTTQIKKANNTWAWCQEVGLDPYKTEFDQESHPRWTKNSQFKIKEPTLFFASKKTWCVPVKSELQISWLYPTSPWWVWDSFGFIETNIRLYPCRCPTLGLGPGSS